MTALAPPMARIAAIDAVRGFAILGILIMNVVGMAMPGAAYDDPRAYGGAAGVDLIAWTAGFVVADGKMRGLFTMLFGASMAIVADRAVARGASPAAVHYQRMAWLLVIGLIHAYAIWHGDILVEYAVTGAILFFAIRWRPAALFYMALVFWGIDIAMHVDGWWALDTLRTVAARPDAAPETIAHWVRLSAPDTAAVARELAAYRGDLASVAAARMANALAIQRMLPQLLIESLGMAALGIGLYRTGYFTRWPVQVHRALIVAGGIALGLTAWVAIGTADLDPVAMARAKVASLVLRPAIMLGYASALILLVANGRRRELGARLAAAGRMALTNYLACSIVLTTIFYGYGGGLFGTLSRAALVPIVLAMWGLILLWSAPWLAHYRYGPIEWLWRSLARRALQPMRIGHKAPRKRD
ncbi:DUF418 domain-containing protein [Hephaestia sp. GCM10023244]|uniref:DUF418 domain-containing protein n=1 Tax=unclassified Hephaestia TaxID=2631281 RepID=UPI002076EB64|nr:DUF418 domain-containing protein [Hephaestia sp. MAHUQ-44]MCM8730787.1 DUF418 domain-containing protein [Hephaestia sp. MAHUQ-44]